MLYIGIILGLYPGYTRVVLGLYGDNGKWELLIHRDYISLLPASPR